MGPREYGQPACRRTVGRTAGRAHMPGPRDLALALPHAELARRDAQLQELSALHELAGDVVVRLHVDEVLPGAEERRGDDPRHLLVLREEPRASLREPARVVASDPGQIPAVDAVDPGPAEVRLVADVLHEDDLSAVDGDVVEHLGSGCVRIAGGPDRPADEQRDAAACARVAGIGEPNTPEPRLTGPVLSRDRAERRRRDEVEVARVLRIPGTVLRTLEVRDATCLAVRLQLGGVARVSRDVDELHVELVPDLPVRLLILGLRDPEHLDAEEVAADEAGLLDGIAGALLRAAVEVDLIADGSVPVVGGGHDRRIAARARIRDDVLERDIPEPRRELVALA